VIAAERGSDGQQEEGVRCTVRAMSVALCCIV
jgi:hypothetical protein